MDREQALAKIKKCLALSRSANEHEAAAALRQATWPGGDMGSTQAIQQRHIGIRHPRPNNAAWRMNKGLSAGGRYACSRVIDALKAEQAAGYTDGMCPDELASALSVAPSEAQKMAWSCWMAGLVVFDIEWGDIVFRLVKD